MYLQSENQKNIGISQNKLGNFRLDTNIYLLIIIVLLVVLVYLMYQHLANLHLEINALKAAVEVQKMESSITPFMKWFSSLDNKYFLGSVTVSLACIVGFGLYYTLGPHLDVIIPDINPVHASNKIVSQHIADLAKLNSKKFIQVFDAVKASEQSTLEAFKSLAKLMKSSLQADSSHVARVTVDDFHNFMSNKK